MSKEITYALVCSKDESFRMIIGQEYIPAYALNDKYTTWTDYNLEEIIKIFNLRTEDYRERGAHFIVKYYRSNLEIVDIFCEDRINKIKSLL